MSNKKDALGRPTKYDPKYCKIVEDLSLKGKTIEQICSKLRISRSTYYLWEQHYPEFKAAHEQGLTDRDAYIDNLIEYQSESEQKFANTTQLKMRAVSNSQKHRDAQQPSNTVTHNNLTINYDSYADVNEELKKKLQNPATKALLERYLKQKEENIIDVTPASDS